MTKSGPASVCVKSRGKARKTLELIEAIESVFDEFDGSMSTRQVYYQCISRGAVQNRPSEYDRVQRLLVELRRDGTIAYDRVVDRARRKHQRAGWDGIEEILDASATQYRRDMWADQKLVVMVACEKQALEGIFAEAVDEYGASLWTLHGYGSESFIFEWATEIRRLNAQGKAVVIRYFGDHDPSGFGIEADAREKLSRHGARYGWRRDGLVTADFDRFESVELPTKVTDTRSRKYVEQYGNRAAELDALLPAELRGRIASSIESCINVEAWDRLQRTEETERESLRLVSENWQMAVRAVQQ